MMWDSIQFEYYEWFVIEVKRLNMIRDIETLLPIEKRNEYVGKILQDYLDILHEEPPVWTLELLSNYLLREYLSNRSRSKGNVDIPILSKAQLDRRRGKEVSSNQEDKLTYFSELYAVSSNDRYKTKTVSMSADDWWSDND